MSQVMNASKGDIFNNDYWGTRNGHVFIPIDDEDFLQFPESTPFVFVEDITLNEDSLNHHINPMLSPSLCYLKNVHPYFFENEEKYLIILNWGYTQFKSKKRAIKELVEEIRKDGHEPLDFVFFRTPYHDTGSDYISEHILEYFLSCYLRKNGFIVDKFSESLKGEDNRKFPDLYAIKAPNIQNFLIRKGLIQYGAYLCELELQNNSIPKHKEVNEEVIIAIEVESTKKSRSNGVLRQLIPSLGSGYYNEGILFAPFIDDITQNVKDYKVGFGTIQRDGKICIERCSGNYGIDKKVLKIRRMFERIIKLTLLKNLSLRQVFDLLPDVRSFYDLYFAVDKLDINEIVTSIKG